MKAKIFSVFLALLLISTLHLPKTFAEYESYTQLGLPEGAKARFGKGWISETAYSAIAYAPDGTRLAVASSVGIWIYDVKTGEELDLLVGHEDSVNSVAFSPDGETIVSGSQDKMIRLWDANTANSSKHSQDIRVKSIAWRFGQMSKRSLPGVQMVQSCCGNLHPDPSLNEFHEIPVFMYFIPNSR